MSRLDVLLNLCFEGIKGRKPRLVPDFGVELNAQCLTVKVYLNARKMGLNPQSFFPLSEGLGASQCS